MGRAEAPGGRGRLGRRAAAGPPACARRAVAQRLGVPAAHGRCRRHAGAASLFGDPATLLHARVLAQGMAA